jgi:hypothetical protein
MKIPRISDVEKRYADLWHMRLSSGEYLFDDHIVALMHYMSKGDGPGVGHFVRAIHYL